MAVTSALVVSAGFAACAGGPPLPGLPSGGDIAGTANLVVGSLQPGEATHQALPSAEVYSRIARGANACWLGPRGRLGSTHILHAEVSPTMNGGAVEIVIHERATDQPKPWGYKAFRVVLTESTGIDGTPGAGGTSIAVENARLPQAEGQRMRAEVFRWAAGTEGCIADPALDKPVPLQPAAMAAPAKKAPVRKSPPKVSAQTTAAGAAPK